jgi:release factor glutamine methyltransferase
MTLADAISKAAASLEPSGVEEPRREAATLAAFAIGRDRTFVFAHPEYELSAAEERLFTNAVERRAAREPFHYITCVKEFYGLDFRVRPGVLIPRPETELLVEEAIARLRTLERPRFLEIGVGSGCVSVSILRNLPAASALGTDISPVALETARENAVAQNIDKRLELRFGSTYADSCEEFDLIVSNPPYIPEGDRETLELDVVGYEPAEALFSGDDGLDVVRLIVAGAERHLRPGGSLLIEIGIGQAAAVRQMLAAAGLSDVRFIRDLQGIERVAAARSGKPCI